MKRILVEKGKVIQRAGEVNTKVYHVVKGLLRSYVTDNRGREFIYQFAPEGWVIADSCLSELPAALVIDALEDSEIIIMSKDPTRERVNVEAFIKRIWVLQTRIISLMSAPAIERYEHFVETYPDITQRVPQKMIASYLGITPEALSKAKGDRIRKNR